MDLSLAAAINFYITAARPALVSRANILKNPSSAMWEMQPKKIIKTTIACIYIIKIKILTRLAGHVSPRGQRENFKSVFWGIQKFQGYLRALESVYSNPGLTSSISRLYTLIKLIICIIGKK
jgi:hypothetical protein